ncbi:MAG: hypothetical protein FRX49_07311 [Trebouxia sp. A1-2]|nr:MAG: hypothetical protein FRX49_07311 [Trebouxia sp. A1-2]
MHVPEQHDGSTLLESELNHAIDGIAIPVLQSQDGLLRKPCFQQPTSFSELCQQPPVVSGQEGCVRVCGVSSVKTAHLGRPVAGSTGNQIR